MNRNIPLYTPGALQKAEQERLAGIQSDKWLDSDGKPISALENEPFQDMTDAEFAVCLKANR